MNIADWINFGQHHLKQCVFINQNRLEAELILAHILSVDRSFLHAHPEQQLNLTQLKQAQYFLDQRLKNYPLAYLTGTKDFFGHDFIMTPDVLIPRPESEAMVQAAIKFSRRFDEPRILDLGTGSGALGISLALALNSEHKTYSLFLADISPKALKVARKNAERFKIDATFTQSDLLNKLPNSAQFDLILANLPYVDPRWDFQNGIQDEPALALFAEDHGLAIIQSFLKQLLDHPRFLSTKARIFLEFDPCQKTKLQDFLAANGFKSIASKDFLSIIELAKLPRLDPTP